MAVRQRMDLRQTQSLVMTPQLQQAIKLLELSNQELAAYVEQEIEQNPLLELEDAAEAIGEAAGNDSDTTTGGTEPRDASEIASTEAMPDSAESSLDGDYDNLWTNDGSEGGGNPPSLLTAGAGRGPDSDGADRVDALEQTLSREVSLREHLLEQIAVDLSDPTDRIIGYALVEQLDEAGYLSGELSQVASRLGWPLARGPATLQRLQQFDPHRGVARDLAECLALQLRDRDRLDPAMQALLSHLDLLARGERERLLRLCQVDGEDLADMIAEIKALNPKPAEPFTST